MSRPFIAIQTAARQHRRRHERSAARGTMVRGSTLNCAAAQAKTMRRTAAHAAPKGARQHAELRGSTGEDDERSAARGTMERGSTLNCAAAQTKTMRRTAARAAPRGAWQHVELRGSTGDDDEAYCRARGTMERGSTLNCAAAQAKTRA